MLVVSNITKRFHPTDDPVLRNISFTVTPGQRIGIVGPNGVGKSTLLRMIMGEIAPDEGSVQFIPFNLRVGYLAQGLDLSEVPRTLGDFLLPEQVLLRATEAEIERLSDALATATAAEFDHVLSVYTHALEQLEMLSAVDDSNRVMGLLAGLGLAHFGLDTPVNILSGGQKTRLGLVALLRKDPQLLVLDEPTNHLDITALTWLEDWLIQFEGGVVMVSHDRTFLDQTATHILALDENTRSANLYPGNYRGYVLAMQSEQDKHWAEWRDQQAEIARLRADATRMMSWAVRRENTVGGDYKARKLARRAKAKEKRLERYLTADERVEKPPQTWNLKLDFGDLPTPGQQVIELQNLSVGYLPDAPLLRAINLTVRAGERVVLAGQNGLGKTTLIKTIMGDLSPLVGQVRLGASVKIGYLAQEQEFLNLAEDALTHLLREARFSHTSARSFLHYFLFAGDDVFRPTGLLSYGERSRLMLAILVARGANFLILDEPINHLDIPSRELFEQALGNFQGSVLAVVHDRYFVDKFATTVWHIQEQQLGVEIVVPLMS
jgi:ATP-binding cassette subfamily F protein 3